MAAFRPITKIGGAAYTGRDPSSYEFVISDVSDPDAGRTEDVMMHKKRIGQVCSLKLSWQNLTTAEAAVILQAFNPEYLSIEYLSPFTGGYTTDTFYVGDRSVPFYHTIKLNGVDTGVWSNLSFNVIRQSGAMLTTS